MYKFRKAAEPTEMAQEIAIDLLSIKEANDGMLNPCHVVDSARDDMSPLHPFFEWDDSLAAEQHRLGQARKLITSIVLVEERPKGKTIEVVTYPVFTHLRSDQHGYRETNEVYSTPELKNSYIAQLQTDWQTFKKKHDDVLKDLVAFRQFDGDIENL